MNIEIEIKNFVSICKSDIKILERGIAIIDFQKIAEFNPEISDLLLEDPNEILIELKKQLDVKEVKIINPPEVIKVKPDYKWECPSCGSLSEEKPKKCSCGRRGGFKEYHKSYTIKEIEEELKKFKQPNLLELIKEEISKEHLSDDNLKMTTFITELSSLSEDPKQRMSLELTGDTSTGKDNIVKSTIKHFPEEIYICLTSGTQATLEDDIHDKRLIVFSEMNLFREGGANRNLLEVIKQITEDGTSALKKDLRTNNPESRHEKGEQKSVIFGTTDVEQDSEAGTRFMKGSVMSSPNVTQKVVEDTFNSFIDFEGRIKKLDKKDSWIKRVLTYFYHKEKYQIIIPYAEFLKEKINGTYIFDYSTPRARRDVKRLLALTCAVTWLYQEQRTIQEYKGMKFLISEPQDLINTLKYTNEFFNQSYTGFDARLNAVINFIENHDSEWVDKKEIQEFLKVSKNTINEYCRELCSLGVQEGCKGSTLNEKEGVRIYDGNRIYYRRVQKEFKKSLVRVQINELEEFLNKRVQEKRVQNDINIKEFQEKTLIGGQNDNKISDLDKKEQKTSELLPKIEPFKLNPFDNSTDSDIKKGNKGNNILSKFTPEQLKQAGYTEEELQEVLKDD